MRVFVFCDATLLYYAAELIDAGAAPFEAVHVMRCFNETTVPTLSTLALEYAVFDSWFSSVPGPTFVNRAYAWCATSNGYGSNSVEEDVVGFTQRSIFRDLQQSNIEYKIYFGDVPTGFSRCFFGARVSGYFALTNKLTFTHV